VLGDENRKLGIESDWYRAEKENGLDARIMLVERIVCMDVELRDVIR
jgi:hypothetical protein